MSKKKREERKQRSEEHREHQERLRRQKQLRSRVMFAVGVAVLVAAGYLTTRRSDGAEKDGKVWSAAHGHWHDK